MIVNFRSNDLFLGTPFNIAQYALLCHLFAHDCGLEVGTLTYNIGDAHIYMNHYEQAKELLSRDYEVYALPTIRIEGERNLLDYTYSNNEKLESSGTFDWIGNGLHIDLKLRPENVVLENYHSYPAIKAQVAV